MFTKPPLISVSEFAMLTGISRQTAYKNAEALGFAVTPTGRKAIPTAAIELLFARELTADEVADILRRRLKSRVAHSQAMKQRHLQAATA